MVDICSSLQAKIKAGDYDNLVPVVAEPWSALHVARKALAVDLDSLDSGDEPKVVQRKRLDLDALAKHYHEHEPTGTFAASVCNMSLEDWLCGQTGLCFSQVLYAARSRTQV